MIESADAHSSRAAPCPDDAVKLCLGIDPAGTDDGPEGLRFEDSLDRHVTFLRSLSAPSASSSLSNPRPGARLPSLKPNLAFFLRHGSRGIQALESFVADFRDAHSVVLDGKFGEIGNTLSAYLDFTFKTLGAHCVTINPFLGEHTLEQAFEACATHAGARGRVYVLCATSERPQKELSFLASHPESIIEACLRARERVFGPSGENEHARLAGVVVGANREDVLFSPALVESGLSVLSPGLGAQGASFDVVARGWASARARDGARCNELTFPLSRGVFGGGALPAAEVARRYQDIAAHFQLPTSAGRNEPMKGL